MQDNYKLGMHEVCNGSNLFAKKPYKQSKVKMTSTEWIFGLASLLSLLFAVYTYFKSREYVYPLIEKLRASRNNFVSIDQTVKRMVTIADAKDKSDTDKVIILRQLARTIQEDTNKRMNTIDDGKNWQDLSVKEIYQLIIR